MADLMVFQALQGLLRTRMFLKCKGEAGRHTKKRQRVDIMFIVKILRIVPPVIRPRKATGWASSCAAQSHLYLVPCSYLNMHKNFLYQQLSWSRLLQTPVVLPEENNFNPLSLATCRLFMHHCTERTFLKCIVLQFLIIAKKIVLFA